MNSEPPDYTTSVYVRNNRVEDDSPPMTAERIRRYTGGDRISFRELGVVNSEDVLERIMTPDTDKFGP
jgi:hypothetical protein